MDINKKANNIVAWQEASEAMEGIRSVLIEHYTDLCKKGFSEKNSIELTIALQNKLLGMGNGEC
jgi:hypothetical protein